MASPQTKLNPKQKPVLHRNHATTPEDHIDSDSEEAKRAERSTRQAFADMRRRMTDHEFFMKMLEKYEKQEEIADRLFRSEEFFAEQLQMVKSKESVEDFFKNYRGSEEEMKKVANWGSTEGVALVKRCGEEKERVAEKVEEEEEVSETPVQKLKFYQQCKSMLSRCKNRSKK